MRFIDDPDCVIGQKLVNDQLVRIGDNERKSGLYILGKPRMGKSWLMINMILQDIENGHGIFFLDTHGDAIDDLKSRTDSNVILLDPEKERFCFGINPLECANIDSMVERMEGVSRIERDNRVITHALSSAGQAIGAAGRQTRILISLTEERSNLQLMFRELNKFQSGVMERRMLPSREEFSQFLIQKICNLCNIADS